MRRLSSGVFLLALFIGSGPLWADDENLTAPEPKASSSSRAGENSPMIELVDMPTAEILDPMTYAIMNRFYSEGGLMSRFILGPLKRVNLGISFDIQNMIGGGSPHMIAPSVFFKVHAYDGSDFLPSLSFGYDNQGFLWQRNIDEFKDREVGLYMVGTHEIFIPDLDVHGGVNVNEFDSSSKPYGFFGLSYLLTKSFALMSEYANINNLSDARFDMSGCYWVAPYFNVELGARHIGKSSNDGAERIIKLNYVGNFPF